jgi:coproporphyrinogen III oxidase-like Fe-S oxidoreductase
MGYTVMPASDQIGIGTTAIGDVGSAYAANEKNLARWSRAVDEGRAARSSAASGGPPRTSFGAR